MGQSTSALGFHVAVISIRRAEKAHNDLAANLRVRAALLPGDPLTADRVCELLPDHWTVFGAGWVTLCTC